MIETGRFSIMQRIGHKIQQRWHSSCSRVLFGTIGWLYAKEKLSASITVIAELSMLLDGFVARPDWQPD
jgi:hypothetical protein